MNNEGEKSKIYAVVIRSRNLENLRIFYRDVLELGPPTIDSNYWTEFSLGNGTNLVLELIDEDDGENCSIEKQSTDWALRVEDLDAKKERLSEAKVELIGEEVDRFGKRVLICRDPDGNLIHLISEK